MSASGYRPRSSTNWLAVLAGTAFCAGAAFVMAKHLDEAVGTSIADFPPEPARPPSPAFPISAPATSSAVPISTPTPLPPEEEGWHQQQLGSISLQLPGDPTEDEKPGWYDRYANVTRLHAYSIPVEHRQSHIRVSVIRYAKGNISLDAAALAAKRGIEAEFSGVTTVLPFNFRDLPSRQVVSRPVDLEDLTRQHTYLLINKNEMLVLSVTGYDQQPNRLAHQILRTVHLQ